MQITQLFLLLLQVLIEQVHSQRSLWCVLDQVLEIVGVARETAYGVGLRFDEFLFQVMSNLAAGRNK